MQNSNIISIGIINFINCLPINYCLEKWHLERLKISSGYPTLINQLFNDGQLHVAPVSSIEYIKNKDKYTLIKTACISSNGEIGSVILFSKYKINELHNKTVGIPYTSATSIITLKIILENYGVNINKCNFINHKYQTPLKDALKNQFDAVLYIGDLALTANTSIIDNDSIYKYDIGIEWKKLTNYPMVFGTWVTRSDWKNKQPDDFKWISILLDKAVDAGLTMYLNEIVTITAKKFNLPPNIIEDYLLNKVKYKYTQEHYLSLEILERKYKNIKI